MKRTYESIRRTTAFYCCILKETVDSRLFMYTCQYFVDHICLGLWSRGNCIANDWGGVCSDPVSKNLDCGDSAPRRPRKFCSAPRQTNEHAEKWELFPRARSGLSGTGLLHLAFSSLRGATRGSSGVGILGTGGGDVGEAAPAVDAPGVGLDGHEGVSSAGWAATGAEWTLQLLMHGPKKL